MGGRVYWNGEPGGGGGSGGTEGPVLVSSLLALL
jgi:hypothetical protein